jgi:NADPH:quinone reductase
VARRRGIRSRPKGHVLKVVRLRDGGLEVTERPTPTPVGDQVLVEVAGAGVNRADLLQRLGRYPAPPGAPSDVPGLEFAGTVAAVGPEARSLGVGARVCGILGGGGQASHVVTRASLCAAVPQGVDLTEAGGIPEVFVTAHDAMLVQAGLRPGERVLVHGVGSGVGTAAVQLARAVGARTVGTSRTPSKLERARALGLQDAVAAGDDMAQRIGEVDVVLDLVGGSYLTTDISVCRPNGRIMMVGLLAGSAASLDLGRLLRRRITVMGTVLRTRPDHEKAAVTARFAKEVVPLFEEGLLRTVTERTLPLEEAEAAYELMASDTTFGKVVLTPGG